MYENNHAEFWKNLFHGGLGLPLAATDFPGRAAFRIPLAEAVRLCQLFQPTSERDYDTRNYFKLIAFDDPAGETAPDIPHSVGYMSSSPSGPSPNTISTLVSP